MRPFELTRIRPRFGLTEREGRVRLRASATGKRAGSEDSRHAQHRCQDDQAGHTRCTSPSLIAATRACVRSLISFIAPSPFSQCYATGPSADSLTREARRLVMKAQPRAARDRHNRQQLLGCERAPPTRGSRVLTARVWRVRPRSRRRAAVAESLRRGTARANAELPSRTSATHVPRRGGRAVGRPRAAVRELAGRVLGHPQGSTLDRSTEANVGVSSAVTNVCSHVGRNLPQSAEVEVD